MTHVSVVDAKAQFGALLTEVEQGGEVVITRNGKPVARLVPAVDADRARHAAQGLLQIRQSLRDRGEVFTSEDLEVYRNEGRR